MTDAPADQSALEGKIDQLTAAVMALVAGLGSASSGPAVTPPSSATGPPRVVESALISTPEDTPLWHARFRRATAARLGPLDAYLLAEFGGRGLYRQHRLAILEQPTDFRVFCIEDAAAEDLEEAQKMGADLLMDRGGEMHIASPGADLDPNHS